MRLPSKTTTDFKWQNAFPTFILLHGAVSARLILFYSWHVYVYIESAVVYRIGVCIYQRHLHRGPKPYAWTYHHILLPIPCPSVVYTSWPYPPYRLTIPMYHTYVPNVPHPRTVPVPYPYRTRTQYRTRTVPMYRIHVPNLPYSCTQCTVPCTQCTVPMYPMYRTHVPKNRKPL